LDDDEEENKVIDSFSAQIKGNNVEHSGDCYLKTKTDRFKKHWAVIRSNEIYCYRHEGEPGYRVMHSLVGTFIKELHEEVSQE